jgi:hypothetical protein
LQSAVVLQVASPETQSPVAALQCVAEPQSWSDLQPVAQRPSLQTVSGGRQSEDTTQRYPSGEVHWPETQTV